MTWNSEAMERGVCKFQFMTGLNETCKLDEATLAMMNRPRCGVPDITDGSLATRRVRRYSYGRRWPTSSLTYRIDNVTPDITNREDIENTFVAALEIWSNVSSLTFTRVFGDTPANIAVRFAVRDHGDQASFDGARGVLAHAFLPYDGRVHLDEDELWTMNTYAGINLFQVAAHEFGHALGLGHTHVRSALMAPTYSGYVPNMQLDSDDIAGIQALYGQKPYGSSEEDMPPDPPGCTGDVDAVTTTRDRSTYVFEGSQVWKFASGTSQIATGFPKPIATALPGLPDNIDAAFYYPPSGKTYIFKGSQYWRIDNEELDNGYPRDITPNWRGLPNDIDAAFIWSGNSRVYFIKGDRYYRFYGGVEGGYPRPLSVWRIPGNRVGAAMQWINRRTYFLTPSGDYYRFDDRQFQPERGYPRSVAEVWQRCSSNLQELLEPNDGVSLAPSLLVLIMAVLLLSIP
ncbi:matrix metalloproteinase-16-like [Acanthaster planci]|uniref:Matrix metalloproteinase-16-like n=1 Tax=Acanthaster planci TaxID=133434 RepID=A0A8B7ZGR6_ACAPL|nr:matrix metalloproteinase-16-like [Acanthaster planci]